MPTGSLSGSGKALFEKVYKASKKAGDSEEVAARKAWSSVKSAGWSKNKEGNWVKKNDLVPEFSMYFSKVNKDNARWAMTASDTLLDLRDEAMSLELYKSFLDNIEKSLPVPEPFADAVTSEWWKGGLPYLSIAHYLDLNGEAVPGQVESVFVDGNCLRAKGQFADNKYGQAVWKSLLEDKSNPDGDKIRVSIAFLDLAHRHGDFVFERKSLEDYCPMCQAGSGNKVYTKGYLVHLALTRKPVNPRTDFVEELSMAEIKTRLDDAASIVGEELAKEVAEKQKALVGRSDVLIERSEENGEENEQETKELIQEIEEKVLEDNTVSTPAPEYKSDVAQVETKALTSLKDAIAAKEAREEMYRISDLWYMVQDVMWSILDSTEITDKKKSIMTLMDDYKSAISSKSMETKSLADMFGMEEKSKVAGVTMEELTKAMYEIIDQFGRKWGFNNDGEQEVEEVSESGKVVEDSLVAFKSAVMETLSMKSVTIEDKLVALQPAMNKLGEDVQMVIRSSVEEPKVDPVQNDDVDAKINKALTPVLKQLSLIAAKLSEAQPQVSKSKQSVPQPRSLTPVQMQSMTTQKKPKYSPVELIARRSVGLED